MGPKKVRNSLKTWTEKRGPFKSDNILASNGSTFGKQVIGYTGRRLSEALELMGCSVVLTLKALTFFNLE